MLSLRPNEVDMSFFLHAVVTEMATFDRFPLSKISEFTARFQLISAERSRFKQGTPTDLAAVWGLLPRDHPGQEILSKAKKLF